jgi:hypothetical protein
MAGGPLLPSSIYLGGASGLLYPAFYISTGGTTPAQSALEGIGVIATLTADAPAVLQFNMPEVIPTGVLKLRVLAMANATTGNAKYTIKDGSTSAAANIANTTLTTEASANPFTQAWAGGSNDILIENKLTLTATAPTANQITTVLATFNTASWTLAAASVWQMSLVWE